MSPCPARTFQLGPACAFRTACDKSWITRPATTADCLPTTSVRVLSAACTSASPTTATRTPSDRLPGLCPAAPRPLTGTVAAVSVGIVGGVLLLDLDYEE